MRPRFFNKYGCTVSLLALTCATYGRAAPILRTQVNQRGDFVMFGNTLGWDCATNAAAVLTGTVNCAGVTNTADTAIDVYWRSDQPATGQALASTAITMTNARSTAVLVLPSGARITYARLYWAAYQPAGGAADTTALIERPGTTVTRAVTADANWTALVPASNGEFWYQGSADITDLLVSAGPGAFRVSGVSSVANLNTLNNQVTMAGWAVVVLYQRDADPPRNLALFDGLDPVGPGQPQSASLSGFLVPLAGFTAKLGVLAYEGDEQYTGDHFLFNGTVLSDALNPADNFFNATHSNLGVGVSNVGDLPRLTGAPRSMGGVDLDVVDITSLVHQGDESATIGANTTNDRYVLGAFVTSISTFKPDFSSSGKTVRDINGGALRPGDVLEYTVIATNSGNDASLHTVMTDVLPSQVTYVPGSLALLTPTAQTLTDASGDDNGEYNASSRTVTVRLGTGASATQGGSMAIGATITLRFQVTLNASASGTVDNQAVISADGLLGAPTGAFPTDGNGSGDGVPPTTIVIDVCGADSDCSGATPYCDTSSSPRVCVACITSAQCTSLTAPECNATTHVCECPAGSVSCQDTDHDGLTDITEVSIGTNPNDADSDDDGVPDGSELAPGTDTDGDGLINALDPDSDNDGLFDGTEMGLGCSGAGTDLSAKRCVPDADFGLTKTNPLVADTDGGGKSDGSEDSNLNGVVDTGETDPTEGHANDDSSVIDSDGDGLSDRLEIFLGSNPNDRDSDDDGVIDGLEANPSDDVDRDGLIDVLDPDSDGDGLFDGTEMGLGCSGAGTDVAAGHCIADADSGQTRTLVLVPDTDRGGMIDGLEDTNHDGRVDINERNPNDPSDDSAQCYADSECGAINSGRVCDTTHLCINGCRGIAGNGCPTGQTCSSSNDLIGTCSTVAGTGGAPSTGGTTSTGGAPAAGGTLATGGVAATGGASANGGTVATGGVVGTGGVSATGGTIAMGGVSATGGTVATGGVVGMGGAVATGGVVGTGGAVATGGVVGTGGAVASGGVGAGGTSNTGGAFATGGSNANGGSGQSGGAAGASGTATGGSSATGASATGGSGQAVAGETSVDAGTGSPNTGETVEGGGCSCDVAGRERSSGGWLALLAGTLLFWRRRRGG